MVQNNIVINCGGCGNCSGCGVNHVNNDDKYNDLSKALITNPLVQVPFSYYDLG